MSFAEKLRKLRKNKGDIQLDLAEHLGVSKMCVSHWEKGHNEPSIEQLKMLAAYFDISIDELVDHKK